MPTYVVTGPDGKRYRVTAPEGASEADVMARVRGQGAQKPTSFWQGVVEGATPAAYNALRLLERTNPVLNAARAAGVPRLSNSKGAVDARLARSPYRGSTAGKITGEVLATAPSALLPGSGVLAAAGQGAVGGAMLSQREDPRELLRNAALGAAGGAIGQQVGKRVIAPVAERVGRSAPARAIARQVSKLTKAPMLPNPRITRPERIVSKAVPDGVRQNVDDAARLGLPLSLADADPELRALAGSVSRFSPEGRALAERNFDARAMGQADRAVNAIDQYLAPVTDIEARAQQIMDTGAAQYRPLYEKAYANPPVSSPDLDRILSTPTGKQAIARANRIAADEYRDPRTMGFVLDKEGQVVLDPTLNLGADEAGNLTMSQSPMQQRGFSTQSLDYVKRGMDDILEGYRDPITNRLKLDEAGRAMNGVKNDLLNVIDATNPEYAAARQSYQQFAKQAEALRNGNKVLPNGALPERNFNRFLARADERTLPELQRGYATAMADTVNRQRRSSNPYNAVYGSPLQQSKVDQLFPNGAQDFRRVYDLEAEMAKTRAETLGGSQTQPRNIADQMFQGGIGSDMADMGIQAITGGGVPGATKALAAVARYAKDRSNLGLMGAQRKADELAPVLFDTNPQSIQALLEEISRKTAEREMRRNAYRRSMGLLGAPAAALGVGFSQ